MFIISLHYIRPIADIETHLDAHRHFLDEGYQQGIFLLSGRKEPRDGGIIIAQADNRAEIEKWIQKDPFYKHQVAEYQVTEFIPSKTAIGLEKFKNC